MRYQEIMQYSRDLKVLFVEDDENFRNETKEILNIFFSRVDIASNGLEGIEKFKEFFLENDSYYDLVITDISMPLMSGEEFIQQIKTINDSQFIVVVSAHTEPSKLINLIKFGIHDFLSKPVSQEGLQDCLYNISKKIYINKNEHKYSQNNDEGVNIHNLLHSDEGYIDIYT